MSMRLFDRTPDLIEIAIAAAYLEAPGIRPAALAESITAAVIDIDDGQLGPYVVEGRLLELVAGCRNLRRHLDTIELAAADQARSRGVSIRQLAGVTGMSERRATSRYPRLPTADNDSGV